MSVIDRTQRPVETSRRSALLTLPWAIVLLDVLTLAVVGALAMRARDTLDIFKQASGLREQMDVVGPLVLLGWLTMIALFGGYQRDILGAGTDEFKRVFNASLATAGLVGITCYLVKYDLPRGFFVLAFALGPVLLVTVRRTARRALHRLRRRGLVSHRVLVVGSPLGIDNMTRLLRKESWLGYSVVGGIAPQTTTATGDETPTGVPLLGKVDDLTALASERVADLVLFAEGYVGTTAEMKGIIYALERHHVHVAMAPRLDNISEDRLRIRPVGGVPIIHVESPRWAAAGRWGKRSFDIVGSLSLITLLSPVLLFAGARIWIHDRGPILFRQTRTGRQGEEFSCLKYRTMVVDAEARLAELQAQTNFDGGLFKMADDPRITRPGRWLRRLSLDELPQLFNVLRGEMSLVGPRPPLPSEVAEYDVTTARRLHVRPGMTGLWQVSGRSDLSWDEAVRLDLYYVDNWSMLQDLSILWRTIGAVASSRGAY